MMKELSDSMSCVLIGVNTSNTVDEITKLYSVTYFNIKSFNESEKLAGITGG